MANETHNRIDYEVRRIEKETKPKKMDFKECNLLQRLSRGFILNKTIFISETLHLGVSSCIPTPFPALCQGKTCSSMLMLPASGKSGMYLNGHCGMSQEEEMGWSEDHDS